MATHAPRDFNRWFARLVEFNKRDERYDDLTADDWQGYFEDGYAPEHAWAEDGTYD